MNCEDCGRTNPDEAAFCAGCGRPLPVAVFGEAGDDVGSTRTAPLTASVSAPTESAEEPVEPAATSGEIPAPEPTEPRAVVVVSPPVVPAPVAPPPVVPPPVAPAPATFAPPAPEPAQSKMPRRPIRPVIWIAAAVVLLGALAIGVPPVVREVRFRLAGAALRNADGPSQVAAAESLAASEDPRAIPLLTQAMADDDVQVRKAAQDGLLSFGQAALDPCISLLGEGDPAARSGAIEVARRLADGRAVAPLCAMVGDDSNDTAIRASAIQAVSVLGVSAGDSSPVPHLMTAISDEDEDVRVAAIEGLAGFRDASAVEPLVTCLTTGEQRTSDAAAQALEAIGGQSVYPLMCSAADPHAAGRALTVVRRIGPEAADQVVRAIEHQNTRVRRAAIDMIVDYDYNEDSAVEALLARVREDRVIAVRIAAADALGRFKAGAASDYLFTLLCKSGNKALRVAAARALVRIEGTGDRVLLYALRDRNTKAVAKYYKRFIRWGRPETVPIMSDAVLKHGSKSMVVAYLNCGNSKLDKAARRWCSRHGYRVVRESGSGWSGARWGGY